jgi:predicted permease
MSSASPVKQDSTSTKRFSPTKILRIDPQRPVRFVGFWTAVIMPFVLLSLTVIGTTQQSPALLTALLVANVAGLVVGKDYKR